MQQEYQILTQGYYLAPTFINEDNTHKSKIVRKINMTNNNFCSIKIGDILTSFMKMDFTLPMKLSII